MRRAMQDLFSSGLEVYSRLPTRLWVPYFAKYCRGIKAHMGDWCDTQMPANSRREAVNTADREAGGLRLSVRARKGAAAIQATQQFDEQVWRASQGTPFQFARWLSGLAAVLIDWAQFGPPQSAVAYLPVLTLVALLLMPDAKSIGVGSLKFERLTNEVGRQQHTVDRLSEEVSFINDSLIAGSQVNITLGASTVDAAVATAESRGAPFPGAHGDLIAPRPREGRRPARPGVTAR
jgi:hypothetical protein